MKDEAKKRLERLLEGLQEIEEASSASIQCDVISSTLELPLRDTAVWQWIAAVVRETRLEQDLKNRIVLVEVKPAFVEPFPGGKGCICWRGDPVKRDKFKAWIDRLSGRP